MIRASLVVALSASLLALAACNGDSASGNDAGDDGGGPHGIVTCGAALTCDLATDVCCVTPDGSAFCAIGGCPSSTPSSTFRCDDPTDCPSGKLCCGEVATPFFNTSCLKASACGTTNAPVICTFDSNCSVDAGGTSCLPGQTYGPISLKTCQ